jgi:hypothetical protein
MPSSPPKLRSGSRFFAVPALRAQTKKAKLAQARAGCRYPARSAGPRSRTHRCRAIWAAYGGNALGYAAALAVLDAFEQDGLLDRVERLGERVGSGASRTGTETLAHRRRARPGIHAAIHRPLSRATGKPARTQYRDREVFQLHRAETPNREKRPTFVGSAGYPTVSQSQSYQPPTAKPRTARPQMSAQ